MKKIDVLFDMETNDPDDVFTLCFLTYHPQINLRAVTVMPGTNEQVGLVRKILQYTNHPEIPVGSFRPGYDKNCVGPFYHNLLGQITEQDPDKEGYQVILDTLAQFPDTVILTGAPLNNFKQLPDDILINKWVAQGGFAGDNVVPPEHRLAKFEGMNFCPTFNFNGAPQTALKMLGMSSITEKYLVSKNVCHGVIYDQTVHLEFTRIKNQHPGIFLIYKGMDKYLQKKAGGKKFHDPLAACVLINPSICQFAEVEMQRKGGKWGAVVKDGTNTFISIAVDKERFLKELTTHQ